MGFVKRWFPKPKPKPMPMPKPKIIPSTPVSTPIDIPTGITTGGHGGQTILTSSVGIEQEANVAQTVLGGSKKGKNKMGVYS